MKLTAFLSRSRHGIYYFRWPIPAEPAVRRTVRLSLQTRCPNQAGLLSRHLASCGQDLSARLSKGSMRYEDIRNHVQKMLQAELTRRLKELRDHGPDRLVANAAWDNTRALLAEGAETYWETVGKQAQDENLQRFANQSGVPFDDVSTDRAKILPLLHRGLLAMIAELDAKKTELEALELSEAPVATKDRATTLPDIDGAGKTVAEVVELYVSEQVRVGGWVERTRAKQEATLGVLVELVGSETPMNAITKKHAQDVKAVLLTVPARKNTLPKLRKMTLREAAKVQGLPTLSPTTLNGYFGAFFTFADWAVKNAYASGNAFEGMKVRAKRNTTVADQVRTAFSSDAIVTMVKELTRPDSDLVKKECYRWASLIGIFTGARLSEVCSLRVADVQEHDGIWCISINDDDPSGNKRLKTNAARRLVPVHSALMKLGFLDFVARRANFTGDVRLFPEFTHSVKHGYTKNQGHFFNNVFLPALGLKTKHAVFHALRHTMVTRLHQAGIAQPLVQTLIGHEREGVTMKTYFNEGYSVAQLKEAIEGYLIEI